MYCAILKQVQVKVDVRKKSEYKSLELSYVKEIQSLIRKLFLSRNQHMFLVIFVLVPTHIFICFCPVAISGVFLHPQTLHVGFMSISFSGLGL